MTETLQQTPPASPIVSNKFLQMIRSRRNYSFSDLGIPTTHCNEVTDQTILVRPKSVSPKHFSCNEAQNAKIFNICRAKTFMKKNYYIPKAKPSPQTKNPARKGSIIKNGFKTRPDTVLKAIVIDGSNVAMQHGNRHFSWRGLELVVDYFLARGHTDITIVLPKSREGAYKHSVEDFKIATRLINSGAISWAPARQPIDGVRMNPYDDRLIIQIAMLKKGIIVSNDQYRDLMQESQEWKEFIRDNLLMFTIVEDTFLFPKDPLGRAGPTLDEFLRLNNKKDSYWDMMKSN